MKTNQRCAGNNGVRKMFGSMTVGRKLGLAFLSMVVVSLAVSSLSLFNFNRLEGASAMNEAQ